MVVSSLQQVVSSAVNYLRYLTVCCRPFISNTSIEKKSSEVKSGNWAAHSIGPPLLLVHQPGKELNCCWTSGLKTTTFRNRRSDWITLSMLRLIWLFYLNKLKYPSLFIFAPKKASRVVWLPNIRAHAFIFREYLI